MDPPNRIVNGADGDPTAQDNGPDGDDQKRKKVGLEGSGRTKVRTQIANASWRQPGPGPSRPATRPRNVTPIGQD